MTVVVATRLGCDSRNVQRLEQSLHWQARTKQDAERLGRLDHCLATGREGMWSIEEWEDLGDFESFFDHTIEYRVTIGEAGFRGYPGDIQIWELLPGPDEPKFEAGLGLPDAAPGLGLGAE